MSFTWGSKVVRSALRAAAFEEGNALGIAVKINRAWAAKIVQSTNFPWQIGFQVTPLKMFFRFG
jgi:hypothetical protein